MALNGGFIHLYEYTRRRLIELRLVVYILAVVTVEFTFACGSVTGP